MTISSMVSSSSALLLGAGGLALLFASDAILPALVPGIPADAAWLGQVVAAGWLGVALLNWNSRDSVLGGIYGRPVVSLNVVLYVVSALGLWKAPAPPAALWALTAPMTVLAVVYAALLLRGPFDGAPSQSGAA